MAPTVASVDDSMTSNWRVAPDERDEVLTKTVFPGRTISILKSRLFSMSYAQASQDPDAREFLDEWSQRHVLVDRRDQIAATGKDPLRDPKIGPALWSSMTGGSDPESAANYGGSPTPTKSFRFGHCPTKDAMGWDLVPDSVQRTICVGVHTVFGVIATAAVMAIVWGIGKVGDAVGD